MGQFLRDQRLANVTLDDSALKRLNNIFSARVAAHNQSVPKDRAHSLGIPFYVLRFDDRGYRFINFDEVARDYADARKVERVVFTMESRENRESAGLVGAAVEIRLDARDSNNCWIMVTSENKEWVEGTFSAIAEFFQGQRGLSRFVRTEWTPLLIQIVGVAVGLVLSLWAALKAAPRLDMENAFAIAFVFAFLIFSNLWGYINAQIAKGIDYAFPNVRFKRTGKDVWSRIIEGAVLGVLVALFLFVLDQLFAFAASVISGFIK